MAFEGTFWGDNHEIYLLYYLLFVDVRKTLDVALVQANEGKIGKWKLWLINENEIYDYDFEF